MNKYSCRFCEKSFSLHKNLLRHKRIVHENNKVKEFKCEFCEYSSRRSDVIRRHKLIHNADSKCKPRGQLNNCAICEYECVRRREMHLHYKSVHNIILLPTESKEFQNEQEFSDWKATIEKTESSRFVRNRGKLITADGRSRITYVCFRDGFYKGKGANLRRMKDLGTNKINGYCPAKMDVHIFPSGKVKIKFLKTHVGHENDPNRLLSKKERANSSLKITSNKRSSINKMTNESCSKSGETEIKVLHVDEKLNESPFQETAMKELHNEKRTEDSNKLSQRRVYEMEENVLSIDEKSNESALEEITTNELQNEKSTGDYNNLSRRRELVKNKLLNLVNRAQSEREVEILEKLVRIGETMLSTHQSLHRNSDTPVLDS